MANAEHSPLPWRTDYSWHDILDAGGAPVADFVAHADATLIVRAVNSHAALVEALEEIRRICSDLPIVERNPRFAAANQKALAALWLAKEGQPS